MTRMLVVTYILFAMRLAAWYIGILPAAVVGVEMSGPPDIFDIVFPLANLLFTGTILALATLCIIQAVRASEVKSGIAYWFSYWCSYRSGLQASSRLEQGWQPSTEFGYLHRDSWVAPAMPWETGLIPVEQQPH